MPASTVPKPLIGLTCRWDEEKSRFYLSSNYAEAIASAGGTPVLIPLVSGTAAELTSRLDGIVLTGSESDVDPARYARARHPEVKCVHAERDETDFEVLRQAFQDKKPVLGVCYGMQALNVYLGGTLFQHIPEVFPEALPHQSSSAHHLARLERGSRLAEWAQGKREVHVNSTHHQAVENPGRGLRVVAKAPDGVVEAVEGGWPDHLVIGVQWHPERIWHTEPLSARLFSELIDAALKTRAVQSR